MEETGLTYSEGMLCAGGNEKGSCQVRKTYISQDSNKLLRETAEEPSQLMEFLLVLSVEVDLTFVPR